MTSPVSPDISRNLEHFDGCMENAGYFLLPEVVPSRLVNRMRDDLETAYAICRPIQESNGIGDKTAFTVHHLPAIPQCQSFVEFLDTNPSALYLQRWFGGKPFILNSFGGAINTAHSRSYAHQIHTDIRSYSPDRLMLNTLVMLDDFTDLNGSTELAWRSHRSPEKPTEEEFKKRAVRITGPAGSILMFDSRVWHRGGDNETDSVRRSVTPLFCRPFYRPEFDYARSIGEEFRQDLSPTLLQLFGFNSRIPCSLSEFYQPPEKRFYQRGQG